MTSPVPAATHCHWGRRRATDIALSPRTIAAIAAVTTLGAARQWLAWRLNLRAILFLLVTGILIGPVAGWLDSDASLGPLLFPFVSLPGSVILVEGSLTLRFLRNVRRSAPRSRP